MARQTKRYLYNVVQSIVQEEELTKDMLQCMSVAGRLAIARKHVKRRRLLPMARIIAAYQRPIDVNGFELRDGWSLLREATALVLANELKYTRGFSPCGSRRVAGKVEHYS